MPVKKPQILLTNDDGIDSPGLWAAARVLSSLGYVNVIAPREQFSGAGRSLPSTSDGIIKPQQMTVNGQTWEVYSVGGAPAQTVLHAVLEVLPELPDLLVSGINFGENVGSGVTISGTVGAALEGASMGIPSLAVSLETEPEHHYSHSEEVDFSVAAYFTHYFAQLVLEKGLPEDVDVLKIDVPCNASPKTPWVMTRLSRQRYFEATRPERHSWDVPGRVGYRRMPDFEKEQPDTDVYALQVQRLVSVTPLSLDLTSRIDLQTYEQRLRQAQGPIT
jgi:5'-nucleotidase